MNGSGVAIRAFLTLCLCVAVTVDNIAGTVALSALLIAIALDDR